MGRERDYLQSLLAGESRAYGFTIAFWGSGAMLISQYGMPGFIQAVAYGTGAVTGFGLLALIAFKNTFSAIEDTKSTMVVLSMMHYLAALIPLVISKIIIENIPIPAYGFFLAGMSVSVVYNALSVLEEDIAELLS